MGKFFDEDKTADLREALEKEVLGWKAVEPKKMFGCPCYLASGKLFAFLVSGGLVLTCLEGDSLDEAYSVKGTAPFDGGGRVVKGWPSIPLAGDASLKKLMPLVRESYKRALGKARR